MKTILKTAVLAFLSLTLAGAILQARAQSSNVPEPAPKKSNKPSKYETTGGHVSDDGTIFVADDDLKSWKVANPKAVKDYKNGNVTIQGVKNFQRGSITVKSIRQKNAVISSPGDTGFNFGPSGPPFSESPELAFSL